jgi:hypothetical protein
MFGNAALLTHVAELPIVEYDTSGVSRSRLVPKRMLDDPDDPEYAWDALDCSFRSSRSADTAASPSGGGPLGANWPT